MIPMVAYIGLGSNLQDPIQQIQNALAALKQLPDSTLARHSSLYRSPPMGLADQPDYVNAVAELHTRLAPIKLLDALQAIEVRQGRLSGARRWHARTLDLDLLVYGDQEINTPRLIVPHPGLHERNFVLYPLQEIAADVTLPGLGSIHRLTASCLWGDLVVLSTTSNHLYNGD